MIFGKDRIAMFGFLKKRQWRTAAEGLYLTLVAQSRQPGFYLEQGVPDTVDGRFDMICLHTFLVLRRLGQEPDGQGSDLAQTLFDLMFQDMDRNLREMGVGDLSVGKHIKGMAKALYGRIAAYESGLTATDPAALEEALHRNLYRKVEPTSGQLQAMAAYVRRQAAALDGQAFAALSAGRVSFTD